MLGAIVADFKGPVHAAAEALIFGPHSKESTLLQGLKTGHELLKATEELDFDFSAEASVSHLPKELKALFESSGKRFRPALCFLFGEVFGLTPETLLPYARAVEMTHTASLVHDDVIDEAHERRKITTLNHRYGNTSAVLGGDYLLAKVIGDLVLTGKLDIITDLTDAIKDLADGEWLQHQLKVKFQASLPELETVARKKTGSLMVWSCVTPAKLSNQSAEVIEACRQLGSGIGVFFQTLDDVNDFNPNSGKPFAQDLKVGQLNTVTARMASKSPEVYQAFRLFRESGEFTARAELKAALEETYQGALRLESELNAGFAKLGQDRAPHMIPVFAKMLEKVREAFLPKGI